ncbi:MAG: hypothetical protein JRI36_03775 [Deltaproteobacteria bacterium]|nr:hypothetical protein [Deltaproteobacteria bacterium]
MASATEAAAQELGSAHGKWLKRKPAGWNDSIVTAAKIHHRVEQFWQMPMHPPYETSWVGRDVFASEPESLAFPL